MSLTISGQLVGGRRVSSSLSLTSRTAPTVLEMIRLFTGYFPILSLQYLLLLHLLKQVTSLWGHIAKHLFGLPELSLTDSTNTLGSFCLEHS